VGGQSPFRKKNSQGPSEWTASGMGGGKRRKSNFFGRPRTEAGDTEPPRQEERNKTLFAALWEGEGQRERDSAIRG